MRIRAHQPFFEAIDNTKAGEKIVLVAHGEGEDFVIAAVNEAGQVIGILPPDEPSITKLSSGHNYRATVQRVLRGRGDRRYLAVVVELGLMAGTLSVPGK